MAAPSVFLHAPVQSDGLAGALARPPNIVFADLPNAAIISSRKREAEVYSHDVSRQRLVDDGILISDVSAATDYSFGCQVASMMPQISSAAAVVNSDRIENILITMQAQLAQLGPMQAQLAQLGPMQAQLAQLGPMQVQLAQLNSKFDVLSIKLQNSSAQSDDDAIFPVPVIGKDFPLPVHFPVCILEMRLLDPGNSLSQIETYYDLPHNGTISLRRNRVARANGIRAMF
jgi:hypothetical protein